MKRPSIDKKYFTISIYLLFVIIVSIAFEKTVGNIPQVLNTFTGAFKLVIGILTPFIYGFFIAYILNSPSRWIEQNIYYNFNIGSNPKRARRTLSVFTTYIILIGFLIWIITFIFPEIAENTKNLIVSLQLNAQKLESEGSAYNLTNEYMNNLLAYFNELFATNYTLIDVINIILDPILKTLSSLPTIINTLLTSTVNFAYAVLNAVLGMVIAFYMLSEKEKFAVTIVKILYAFLKKQTAEKIIRIAQNANKIFEKFLVGKTIDSTIIGFMFFIIALIVKLPFALLSSLIIGVTNMIPYFGPIIGAVPVILITLLINPGMALWATLIIFLLQQFDGIILGPKILGDSTGLKAIGVIFSIIVGGALFGVPGMFFGVPVFAVIKITLTSYLDRKYNEKFFPQELEEDEL